LVLLQLPSAEAASKTAIIVTNRLKWFLLLQDESITRVGGEGAAGRIERWAF